MKKSFFDRIHLILILFVAVAMLLLCSCGENKSAVPAASEEASASTVDAPTSAAPTTEEADTESEKETESEETADNTQAFDDLGSLYFAAEEKTSTVRLTTDGEPPAVALEYTTDGVSWSDYTVGETISLDNCGDKVSFRNQSEETTQFSIALGSNYHFELSGKVAAYGDITSLINKNGSVETLPYDCCFCALFRDSAALTKAPELPSETLSKSCYSSMFWNCDGLTKTPELPAETLAAYCYNQMFMGCGNLEEACALPATVMAESCYCSMFRSCQKLQKAPLLPAVTLANSCYYFMFANCSSLSEIPSLPATDLPDACYMYMFEGCNGIMLSETQDGEYSDPFRIPTEGTGQVYVNVYNNVSLSLEGMFNGTGGTFTGEPQVNKTYWLKTGGN